MSHTHQDVSFHVLRSLGLVEQQSHHLLHLTSGHAVREVSWTRGGGFGKGLSKRMGSDTTRDGVHTNKHTPLPKGPWPATAMGAACHTVKGREDIRISPPPRQHKPRRKKERKEQELLVLVVKYWCSSRPDSRDWISMATSWPPIEKKARRRSTTKRYSCNQWRGRKGRGGGRRRRREGSTGTWVNEGEKKKETTEGGRGTHTKKKSEKYGHHRRAAGRTRTPSFPMQGTNQQIKQEGRELEKNPPCQCPLTRENKKGCPGLGRWGRGHARTRILPGWTPQANCSGVR